MARLPVNPPANGPSVVFRPRDWALLDDHLRSGEHERGAVLLAEQVAGPRGRRFLVRRVIKAVDGVDYVPGTTGFRALTAAFVRDCAYLAAKENLTYIAVHNHGGQDHVAFSRVDLASQQRGYPALVQLTGAAVIGLVLARGAAAGRVWWPDGTVGDLGEVVVVGRSLVRLRPSPFKPADPSIRWDRQARMFGSAGQSVLGEMRVAVVGVGGAGSLIVEFLSRLGVGHLVVIDADKVDEHNLPRLIAAGESDIGVEKVESAARNAQRGNPGIVVDKLSTDVQQPEARNALRDCDFIFLAADSHAARHFVNEAVERYLIPGVQVGVKVSVLDDGSVGRVHTVVRPMVPGEGCLWCNHLIDPTRLALDLAEESDREAGRYVPEVPAPSVIALNAVPVADAVNKFMLGVTGLLKNSEPDHIYTYPREASDELREPRRDNVCSWCGDHGQTEGDNSQDDESTEFVSDEVTDRHAQTNQRRRSVLSDGRWSRRRPSWWRP